jgi:hypothetical protein
MASFDKLEKSRGFSVCVYLTLETRSVPRVADAEEVRKTAYRREVAMIG